MDSVKNYALKNSMIAIIFAKDSVVNANSVAMRSVPRSVNKLELVDISAKDNAPNAKSIRSMPSALIYANKL